ncbi:laminin subunit alpha-1 isoform X2 [Ambystoma mexicanum]|uniref:laminin subunit alpha-1 isoform X2 n=1 Tax=Ambystoma mexicanum TaxID=8296 RepID=UPI0037E8432B
MPCHRTALLLLLLRVTALRSQQLRGLFPAILNLASNADITTNATCGENGPEMFCKLVEHVPGRPIRNAQCRVCDQNSANPKEKHPISNAIDGTNNWWQSPSIQNGREYHGVTITLDLKQTFQVAYIIIKAANSPRPGNWILERSIDGVDYTPWQYYAISDTECLTRYNVTPRLGPPTYKRDNEVICTSYYSRLVPLEHGEIHTSLINGRPSADDLTPALLDFTSARYIRLRLQRIRTLNADLMTLNRRDLKDVDPIVTRRYYYSIKDISVGGMCICYGHASSCPWDEETKKMQCVCEHNTCGVSCDECCPGHHQTLWQPGTLSTGNRCEKCNCHNKAEDCYFDQNVADRNLSLNMHGLFVGGGVCMNCTEYTAGINCETCIDGYFRPYQMSPYEADPCRPCECDAFGSLSPICVKDDKHAELEKGILPGQCQCREGYTGEKCDRCVFGYRGYPHCLHCNCSLVGSVNDDPCTEPCFCKENVEGENCDRCKPGSYNLQERNPRGCTDCFCFGVSDVCESLFWHVTRVSEISGWLVTDQEGENSMEPQRDLFDGPHQISINSTEARKTLTSTIYWEAPRAYLGNKLTAYGGYLKYTVSYDIPEDSTDSELFSDMDVIIQGNGRSLSTRSNGLLLQPFEEHSTGLEILPENFVDFYTKRPVDRDVLMTVLANMNSLQIRASYSVAQKAVYRLSSVSLDTARPNVIDLLPAVNVENCECPPGYTGTSCESCISGYYRVDGILFGGNCQPCECNGHATECDTNGMCFDCQHNTTGPHCDQCSPGFYGTPSRGTPDDCQPCACPLNITSNNFSPTCHLDEAGAVICDQCPAGYAGSRCERCANGHYGNPSMPSGTCVPCDCNGNVDTLEPGHCDAVTGECLKCIQNTAGRQCERCADGYYGDAVVAKNCSACACHANSSYSSTCHHETGTCECKPNVIGQRCDQCLSGYYGLTTGQGCLSCNCSTAGSLSGDCSDEGQCHCAPSVSGEKCDACAHGFYAFQDGGCTPCDCAHTQNNCDPGTGHCICPPHTLGPKCELCEANYWGHNPALGCKACNCSAIGSTNLQCDLLSGQCECSNAFGGANCDRCAFGFRGHPDCVPCECDAKGTQKEWCDEKKALCSCEEDSGTCSCKENVAGPLCSKCKAGTFALRSENPLGCSSCFCFGLTTVCSELQGYVKIPIPLIPNNTVLRVVTQDNLTGTSEGVFVQSSEMVLDAATVLQHLQAEPFYWRLPAQFQGDKLQAYGGKLKYVTAFHALGESGASDVEPQILIKGGHRSKLVIYADISAPENGVRSEVEVEMKEHFWKYSNSVSEHSVSHSDFLSVLSNIEYILIKASYGQALQQSRISNISMEVAVAEQSMHPGREAAHLIEKCDCPAGYSGLSCQECSPGYYREKVSDMNVIGPRPLMAPCVPCECNNHSETCDPETGECQGCRDHTIGDHCDVCAAGYYGSVTGSISDCSLCACPHRSPQSFSPTCVLEGMADFRCNACLDGYEGQYCERCSLGYFGNPSKAGGRCQQCDCNPSGSVHDHCDRRSGQCVCKQGVTGLRCDTCEPRHILLEKECVSCDDDCTGLLLNDLDSLGRAVSLVNFTGVALAPHGIVSDLAHVSGHLKEVLSSRVNASHSVLRSAETLANNSEAANKLHEQVTQAFEKGKHLNSASVRMLQKTKEVAENIEKLRGTIKVYAEVALTLNESLASEFLLSNSSLEELQQNVSGMLESMRRRDFLQLNHSSSSELKAAHKVLLRVKKDYGKNHQEEREKIDSFKALLASHQNSLSEAKELVDEANASTTETGHLQLLFKRNLGELNVKNQNILDNKNQSVTFIEEGVALVNEAMVLSENVSNSTSALDVHRDEMMLWSANLRYHVDNLVMQMSKREALGLVYRAEDHATELQRLANSLESSLSDVRNVTLNATNAVHSHAFIKSRIDQAGRLAQEVNSTLADPVQLNSSLDSAGRKALNISAELLTEVKTMTNKTEGIVSGMERIKTKVDLIRKNTSQMASLLNESLNVLQMLPIDTSEKLPEAKELAISANATVIDALNRIRNFSQRLQNTSSALPGVIEALQKTNDLIKDSSMAVHSAEKKVKEAQAQVGLLFDRLKPLKILEENLSRNLSEIKELISQARKEAASIKVAVLADRDCVRAYQPPISSSNFNTLSLNMRTHDSDNLLFYLGSSTNMDFLALEMRRGLVSFLWDLGSGATKLEYSNFQLKNNTWYRIHATRFGKTGTLSVNEIKSTQKPLVKTATATGTSTILDVDKSTLMFVGGLGGQIKKSPAVKVTHFRGCVEDVSLNGKPIGLWNYIEREGKCGGCHESSSEKRDTSFQFDGSGYSIVEKTLRPETTYIEMHFSTLSQNGLLLYLASDGTRDFLSFELVDGRVRLTIDLGSGPLVMTTEKRYNDGSWYMLSYGRNKRKGYLAVMDAFNTRQNETMRGESPGNAADLNRSAKDPIYIGGLPRSRTVRKELSSRSFVGCIKSLEIARSNFDLLTNSYGVRKGCKLEPVRSATILSSGFIELPPISLSSKAEIMATFATKNDTGIILAGLSKGTKKRSRRQAHVPFFSVMLVSGNLEVHMNPGTGTRKVVLKSASGTFSDGQQHSIILIRNKRNVTVQVDESKPTDMKFSTQLQEESSLNVSNVYVGGIPPGEIVPALKTNRSFYGCIQNLIFNMEIVDFTSALRYEQVDKGSCLLSERPRPVVQEEDLESQPDPIPSPAPARPATYREVEAMPTLQIPTASKAQCADDDRPVPLTGAHHFGSSLRSHMVLAFDQSAVRKKFSVQLSIRTYASSGLIFFVAHQNQGDYAALQLHNGKLQFLFDVGKGRAVATHPAVISDGKWHTVKAEYVKRKGSVAVDTEESTAVTALGDGNTLDVEGKLHLGGLPSNYTVKKNGIVTHSMVSCIGNVTVNSKQLDTEAPLSKASVDKCYVTVQEGTFFDGSGYAALVKEGYKVRSDVNISLEFRTAAMNGVLVGISSAKVDAVGLEMVNGKVLFHVNNGAGRITTIYEPKEAKALCDGKWHKLQANKSKHHNILIVDGHLVRAQNPHAQSTSADTNNPIYVGGYPATVKQNCLTSRTPFRGCMRNLLLTKGQHTEAQDFSKAFEHPGVLAHSCPVTEH